MTHDSASMHHLAEQLFREPRDSAASRSAERLVRTGRGAVLMSALLERATAREDRVDAVLELMSTLEGMMDAEPFVATYLMASLYPIAARRREHAICDAVNLWMHSPLPCVSIEALRQLAQEGMRPRFEKQLSDWISVMEAKHPQ